MKAKDVRIEGAITAMVTPFAESGELDVEGLKSNVKFQVDNGISGLVPLGTTGESPTISDEERETVIKVVVAASAGRVPVIVGTGTNSTVHSVELSRQAEELGADAVLVVSPYYNKPTQEGLYRHFKAIAESISIPVVVYNIQGRTAVNIETSTLQRLSQVSNIIAVKEASGSLAQMMDVLEQLPKSFSVVSGDDNLTLPLMALGGRGVISVVSNLLPRKVSDMCAAASKGDFAAARRLHFEMLPFFKAAFIETNPVPIKAAMKMAGMAAGPVRLPLCELQPASFDKLAAVLQKMGVLKAAPKISR
ncbi:MAG TPA: 4-hydroxy-tetrahydrodipicolinate synthase [Candidatus Nanoarchaeia archaeon]|nr:4-hydroxy-tetrahydrodipicolinate synthase [Candidatus Nanoarchaeia archaeon]